MKRGFKSWAEQKSLELRRLCRVPTLSPLAARTLASKLGGVVLAPNEIPEMPGDIVDLLTTRFAGVWSAVCVPTDDAFVVVYNPTHSAARQESDIMHELAHVLCAHTPDRFEMVGELPFLMRHYDISQEEEASWLGACLQIPRAALLSLIRREFSNEALAALFGASEEMIVFRRNMTGIDRQLHRASRFNRIAILPVNNNRVA
jgi:Zn-dependent peptidase ImmA (M78 family)